MTARILVTAGEPSGDLHGGRVISALRRRLPDADIDAVGGPHMAEAGATIRCSIDGLAAMGIVEIVDKLPAHIRLWRQLGAAFRARRYDLVILIDYPGFHLQMARAAKRHGIPVLWYIAPQLWAWRPGRARQLADAVDRLAVILPFEPEFFRRVGIEATYVGHPLLDRAEPTPRADARRALGLPLDARVLALFPGSRRGEIARLWEAYRDAALQLLARGSCTHVVVASTEWARYPGAERFQLVTNRSGQLLAASDAALVKSGTTTLEAALAGVPMVVAYRLNPLSFTVARRLATVRWASLVNLIANRSVVPEFFQRDVNAGRLADALEPLLDADGDARRRQLDELTEVRRRLGSAGASERVAAIAAELLAA
jgi:lipid-A-disaccharide synthase